ncbi:hypothetical protein [Novosphingobium sp. Leaf2]|uniref:hypothetical protein n=1 Tax=Novosphingobium sp. Leaf2 TaxID=1735670 RepID=UPI0006FF8CD5|nr:hypothetical protein [Novosphingobium sp. Leaf2]KQM21587.1 hypothetical protein ASE49_14395 [Novosphingobium sp. Leaf2]
MRTKAAPRLLYGTALLCSAALLLSACDKTGSQPAALASTSAGADGDRVTAAPSDGVADVAAAPTDSAASPTVALDTGALTERRDPERVLRYYVTAVREGNWAAAAKVWSSDAQMTPEKLAAQLGGKAGAKLAVGKGDMDGAAGSSYYEAPVVVDFADGQPSRRGTIVLRRVNDVPGASEEQLTWRIERTSTLSQ